MTLPAVRQVVAAA